MKNNYLEVFKELREQLLDYPRETVYDSALRTITDAQLKKLNYSEGAFSPEKLSRQEIYAKAKGLDEKKVSSEMAKNGVNTSKLKSALKDFINSQPDCKQAFDAIGYFPVVVASSSTGGAKNKTLLWMDIEAIKSEEVEQEQIGESTGIGPDEDIETDTDLSSVNYERKSAYEVKPSLLTRLFFKKGELKMMTFKGLLLMLLLLLSFFIVVVGAIYALFIILLMNEIPNLTLWQAFVCVILIPVAYLSWRDFFMPLYLLPYHRVIKAPMFFANINVDNADIEMYRNKDKLKIARVTEFTATCPICSGLVELANGKPDQSYPLVGRCKESPHAHVYSFDRMTMKGYFLGASGYLTDMKV